MSNISTIRRLAIEENSVTNRIAFVHCGTDHSLKNIAAVRESVTENETSY
jgi:hypothetical protein